MDICGPFTKSHAGNLYMLTVIDLFTSWPEAFALPNKETRTVAHFYQKYILTRYGSARECLTDNGSEFCSGVMEEVFRECGTKHVRTSSYKPSSNGQCERFHAFLVAGIRKMAYTDTMSWDLFIEPVLAGFRALPGPAGESPAYLLMGRDFVINTGPMLVPRARYMGDEDHMHFFQNFRKVWAIAARNISISRKEAEYSDQNEPIEFHPGDLVCVKMHVRGKLQMKWTEPTFRVVKVLSKRTLLLEHTTDGHNRKISVIHVKRCKPQDLWFKAKGDDKNKN
jgi:hypothetical protein